MNAKVVVLALLLIVSIGSAAVIVTKENRRQKGQGFTIYQTNSFYRPGESTPAATDQVVRYQKSDGSWRQEYECNGAKRLGFSQPDRGVFDVDEVNHKLQYMGAPGGRVVTGQMLREETGFVREETMLGFPTFVLHYDRENGAADDFYICPALQGYPLKTISRAPNGGTNVHEVTRVIVGEPPEDLFRSLPNYPVDYELQKQRHP